MLVLQLWRWMACSLIVLATSTSLYGQCQTCGGKSVDGGTGPCASCNGGTGATANGSCQTCGGAMGGNSLCPDCSTPPIHEVGVLPSYYWNDPSCCINDGCMCDSCPPLTPARWFAQAEILPLLRDVSDGGEFQPDATTGVPVLRESMFDPEFAAGTRFTIGRTLGNWYRFEATYLGSYDWDDTVTVLDSNNDATTSTIGSSLQSVELNFRRRINLPYNKFGSPYIPYRGSGSLFMNRRCEASFLLGLRYVDLDDEFTYSSAAGIDTGTDTITNAAVAASNNMLGLQLGLSTQYNVQAHGWVETNIKGGIFHNKVDLVTGYTANNAPQPTLSISDNNTSWLGELNVTYNYQFCSWLTCRVGYNAVAAVDVEVGSNAFENNTALLGSGLLQAEADGQVIYHGPSVGLIGTW